MALDEVSLQALCTEVSDISVAHLGKRLGAKFGAQYQVLETSRLEKLIHSRPYPEVKLSVL